MVARQGRADLLRDYSRKQPVGRFDDDRFEPARTGCRGDLEPDEAAAYDEKTLAPVKSPCDRDGIIEGAQGEDAVAFRTWNR